jgi:hypothetical protein
MPALWKDSRYAVRTLLKAPAYTVVAIATLALGIGANTAIFSVVNQVLLNPAGVAHPERIVSLRVRYDKLALHNIGVSIPDFAVVLHSIRQFDSAALIDWGDFDYTGSAAPERLRGISPGGSTRDTSVRCLRVRLQGSTRRVGRSEARVDSRLVQA